MAWTCPECGRAFGRNKQGHMCAPAMTIDEYFETGPDFERPVFERVLNHLESLGPLHVEPVSVGILLKNERTFSDLRPKKKWVAVSFYLPVKVESDRLARKVIQGGHRWYHVVNVPTVDDVDERLLDWLTEAYFEADADL